MRHWYRWLMAALVGLASAAVSAVFAPGGSLGQGALAQGTIIYVDADATGANNGTSWEDAYTALQPALGDAEDGDDIWVAAGCWRKGASSWADGPGSLRPSLRY